MSAADRDEADLLAAEYVLGVLDPRERAHVEARLDGGDARLAQAVGAWRARLADLDETAAPVKPPPDLWRRIESGLGDEPLAEKAPAPMRPGAAPARPRFSARLWESLALWRGAALAGAAASLALALGLATALDRAKRQPTVIAVLLSPEGKPGAIVEAFGRERAVFVPLADVSVPEGKALELWTQFDADRGPVSLGVIGEARRASFPAADLPPPKPDQFYAISLEPDTGSPTGRPTGPVLMKGTASRTL